MSENGNTQPCNHRIIHGIIHVPDLDQWNYLNAICSKTNLKTSLYLNFLHVCFAELIKKFIYWFLTQIPEKVPVFRVSDLKHLCFH